jgi:hypothetical protein
MMSFNILVMKLTIFEIFREIVANIFYLHSYENFVIIS